MDIVLELSNELNIDKKYVEAVIALLDEGCTVPFIARYRKDVTNSLEDVEIRKLEERLNYLRNLEARKKTILESIETQGKLTPQLKEKIEKVYLHSVVEDEFTTELETDTVHIMEDDDLPVFDEETGEIIEEVQKPRGIRRSRS